MILINGFGWYIWQIAQCGTPQEIVDLSLINDVSHLLVKIADGVYDYNKSGGDPAKQLAGIAQNVGIIVWGWQYVYLKDPKGEADKAVQRVRETGATGFVVDGEAEWKNNEDKAIVYLTHIRNQLGWDFPIALSSYRFPSVHPEFPWDAVRPYVNMDIPQVYWEQAHNAGAQLFKSYNEFIEMTPVLPYLPTGAAYQVNGWEPTAEDVSEFINVASQLKLGYNFWSYQHCKRDVPDVWELLMPLEDNNMPIYIIVNTYRLNVRKGPGVGYSVIDSIPQGLCLHVFERDENTGWYRVGTDMWVSGAYCKAVYE